jgi:hypothetical protein
VRPEGLGQLKNPVTSGIEHATIQLVALFFNQLRCRVPPGAFLGSENPVPPLALNLGEWILIREVVATEPWRRV